MLNYDRAALAWNLPWDADWVTAVTYIGATRRIAAGNKLGQIVLYDLPGQPGGTRPDPIRRLDGHTNAITHLLSSPDGRWLISASYDHTIRYWDMQAAGTGAATIELNAAAREEARTRNRTVPAAVTVEVSLQQSARTLQGHDDWVQALCQTPDGRSLAGGDDLGRIIIRDAASGQERRRWDVRGWIQALAISPNGEQLFASERIRLVFSSDRYTAMKTWNPATGEMIRDLTPANRNERQEIGAAAFSPDGRLLVLGQGGESSGNAKISIYEAATGRKLREISGHQYGTTQLSFSQDGRQLLSSGRDTTVRIWDPNDGRALKQIGTPRGGQFKDWIHAFSVSRDERWLAAADMMGQVQVWHLPG
jgi:WD40 repeat protein